MSLLNIYHNNLICARGTAHSVLQIKFIFAMQMTVFPAQTPAGGNLRTIIATRTMQSVRCAVFGRVKRAITNLNVMHFRRNQSQYFMNATRMYEYLYHCTVCV